jgi:hypothetical protein
MVAAVAVAGAVALITHALPHNLGLIIATLAGIATGIFVESWPRQKEKI